MVAQIQRLLNSFVRSILSVVVGLSMVSLYLFGSLSWGSGESPSPKQVAMVDTLKQIYRIYTDHYGSLELEDRVYGGGFKSRV